MKTTIALAALMALGSSPLAILASTLRAHHTLALMIVSSACARAQKAAPTVDAAAPAAPVVVETVDAAPPRTLDGPAQVVLPGVGVVSVPVGAHAPRPLMIALHGGSDHPEWACNAWRGVTDAYPFIVCPRGPGAESSLAWSSPADTKQRVARAVAATKEMFPDWVVETKTTVLVGFSMGATQTSYLASGAGEIYRRVVLAESSYAPEPAMAFAKPWAHGGGERAIFLCTTPGCPGTYRRAAQNVAAQGVPARLDIAGTTAHGMWDQVVQSMRRDWPWLVAGAEGWDGYTGPSDPSLPGKTESFDPR